MKFVYLIPWQEDPFASLKPVHTDVSFVRVTNEADLITETRNADIVSLGSRFYTPAFAKFVRSGAPQLRWIQTPAIGVETFQAEGVPGHVQLTNAAGLKGSTVSEHVMALLLGLRHAVPQMEQLKARRDWGMEVLRHEIQSVEGQTLLVIGYGSIGKEVARKAKAFDMHVIAVNSTGTGDGQADQIVPMSQLDTVLPMADAVVVSLPLSDQTRGSIGPDRLALLKPSAVLINVGRGNIIDHAALCTALKTKKLAGAALDVFDEEPLPESDPVWDLPNVIISPHIGGFGGPTYARFTALVDENLSLFKAGKPLVNQVSMPRTLYGCG